MQGESDGMRIGFAALSVQGLYGVSYLSGNGTERKTASTPAKGVEGKPFCKGTARFGSALFPMRVEQQPIILLSNIDTLIYELNALFHLRQKTHGRLIRQK